MLKTNRQVTIMLSWEKVIAVLGSIFVLIFSGSPYQTIFDLSLLIFAFGAIAVVLSVPTLKRVSSPQWAIFFLVLMTIFTMVVHLEFSRLFYWRFLCVIFAAYYLTQLYSFDQISNLFTKIMVIVTLISFVGYFLANNTTALNVLPRFLNSNDKEFAIGIVFNFLTGIPERNCGIFWEPGIFATYLILAIVFEIFAIKREPNAKKKKIIHIIIFTIGVFTANSTAGFLLITLCLLLLFVSGRSSRKMRPLANLLSITVFTLFLVFLVNLDAIIMTTSLAENEYIVKLLSSNVESSSRILAMQDNLGVFFNNFLCGAGIEKVSEIQIPFADISTPTYILSIFGVLGLTYIGCIAKGVFQQKNINIYSKLVLFVTIIAVISKEPHLEMPFTWILIFSLLKDKQAL